MLKSLTKLVSFTCAVTYLLILFGVATRVADAGMSCPDWPTCYGVWIPFPAENFTTEYSNIQVFLEWFHRLLASIAGILIGGCALASLRFGGVIRLWGVIAGVSIISQICVGMVTIHHSNEPWTVALHLGNAMVVFGSLILLRRALVVRPIQVAYIPATFWFTGLLWLFCVLVMTTMLIGALVSTSHAGGVCGGLISCLGDFLPADHLQQLHMTHRLFALLTVLTTIALWCESKRQHTAYQKTGRGLLMLVCIQALFGIATLESFRYFADMYAVLSVMHLGWGMLVWMAALGALAKRYWGVGGAFHAGS